jgi:hypothetical protein
MQGDGEYQTPPSSEEASQSSIGELTAHPVSFMNKTREYIGSVEGLQGTLNNKWTFIKKWLFTQDGYCRYGCLV